MSTSIGRRDDRKSIESRTANAWLREQRQQARRPWEGRAANESVVASPGPTLNAQPPDTNGSADARSGRAVVIADLLLGR